MGITHSDTLIDQNHTEMGTWLQSMFTGSWQVPSFMDEIEGYARQRLNQHLNPSREP